MAFRLPVEVVTHVMRFLSVSDRKEMAMVCKAWYEASLDPILQKDIIIHFYASSTTGKDIPGFGRRKMPHLVLNHFDTSLAAKSVMLKSCEHLAVNLQSLSLKGSNITESTFVELMANCKNLVSLDLSHCNSLFMSGRLLEKNSEIQSLKSALVHVKELNLSALRYLSDATFNRIVTVCGNVEKLSLASAQLVFHDAGYYPKEATKCVNGSVLTFPNVVDYVNAQAPHIVSLNFSRTQIADSSLDDLVSIQELNLQEIILVGCRNITDDGIATLCHTQKSLLSVDLKDCSDLTDASFMTITENLAQLKNLNVCKLKQVSDRAVGTLARLKMLEVLDLSECYKVSAPGLIKGLCSDPTITMTHLNLNCCSTVGDTFLEKLCECKSPLIHLDLGSCFAVTDRGVHVIAENLKHLRFLRLAWCKEISDLGLLGLELAPHADHEEHVGNCKCNRNYSSSVIFKRPTKGLEKKTAMSDTDLQHMINAGHQAIRLNNIAGLRSLDLTACKKLSDIGLTQMIKFAELRSLHLGMIPGLSDEGIATIARNNPSIEELNLSQCAALTDVAMETILPKLQRLQTLNVFGCDKLTDKTIKIMLTYCKRLRHLDVSFCSGITGNAMDQLENCMKTLQTVNKRMIGSG